EIFHITKLKSQAKGRRELTHLLLHPFPRLDKSVGLLRIRAGVNWPCRPRLRVVANDLVKRYLGERGQSAAIHERRIEDDAREPCREPRSALERPQIHVSGQQTVLQRVLRVFFIAEQRKGRAVQLCPIAGEERRQRVAIASRGRLAGFPSFAGWFGSV